MNTEGIDIEQPGELRQALLDKLGEVARKAGEIKELLESENFCMANNNYIIGVCTMVEESFRKSIHDLSVVRKRLESKLKGGSRH